MTRGRCFGEDTPFGRWLRNNPRLPSSGTECGFVASDIDMIMMRYRHKSTGTEICSMMQVEVKTRMGEAEFAQMQIMSALSAFSGTRHFRNKTIIFYGVCWLHMSGTDPMNSLVMRWRRFPWTKHDKKREFGASEMMDTAIDVDTLEQILRFDLHPISLRPHKPEKSHHGSRVITVTEQSALGFSYDRTIRETW